MDPRERLATSEAESELARLELLLAEKKRGVEKSSSASKRQRAGTLCDDTTSSRKKARGRGRRDFLSPPVTFSGDTLEALKQFRRHCELQFRLDKDGYDMDTNKVLFAMSRLEGHAAEAWEREEEVRGLDNSTWEEFTAFLRQLVEPCPMERAGHLEDYHNMRQDGHEPINKFLTRLYRAEDLVPEQTEEQLMVSLFVRLNDSLRNRIVFEGLPKTRQELVKMTRRMQMQSSIIGRSQR
ncbi:MAG: hypothetical protein M4579_003759 [Chaenotheca gracillima]|nr:MAG: hypothetical protein M4579_003759 [Chaenotheca gracillima]